MVSSYHLMQHLFLVFVTTKRLYVDSNNVNKSFQASRGKRTPTDFLPVWFKCYRITRKRYPPVAEQAKGNEFAGEESAVLGKNEETKSGVANGLPVKVSWEAAVNPIQLKIPSELSFLAADYESSGEIFNGPFSSVFIDDPVESAKITSLTTFEAIKSAARFLISHPTRYGNMESLSNSDGGSGPSDGSSGSSEHVHTWNPTKGADMIEIDVEKAGRFDDDPVRTTADETRREDIMATMITQQSMLTTPEDQTESCDGIPSIDGLSSLAVAKSVPPDLQDREAHFPLAIGYDPDAKREEEGRKWCLQLYFLVIFLIVALVVAITIPLQLQNDAAGDTVPTFTLTLGPTMSSIQDQLEAIAGDKIDQDGTDHQRAFKWITEEDPANLGKDSPNLVQRFLMAFFSFTVGAEGGNTVHPLRLLVITSVAELPWTREG